jgi:hypothetical protein
MAQKYYNGFKNTKLLWVENLISSSSRYLGQIRVRRDIGNPGMEVTEYICSGSGPPHLRPYVASHGIDHHST